MSDTRPGLKLNRAELAKAFRISLVTVDAYVRRGMPFDQRGSKGKPWIFDSAEVSDWLRQKDVEEALGDLKDIDYKEASRRKMAAEAGLQEFELARVRRTMISVGEIEEIVSEEYGAVRSRLLMIPARVAQIADGKPGEEIERLVEREIIDALTELTADGLGGEGNNGDPDDAGDDGDGDAGS